MGLGRLGFGPVGVPGFGRARVCCKGLPKMMEGAS